MGRISKRRRIRQQLRTTKKPLNPKYLAACYGKIRHTKESAKKAASVKPDIVKAYHCKFCNNWHIGRKQSKDA